MTSFSFGMEVNIFGYTLKFGRLGFWKDTTKALC